MTLVSALIVLVLAAIVLVYACDAFDNAAQYLGRSMKPGVKGATINAVGSSLPELFTTAILLFGPVYAPALFGARADGFSAGIATCAGSAVFNAVIIPACCLGAVLYYGVERKDGSRKKISLVELNKRVALRDAVFFVLAELVLLAFLSNSTMVWWMGLALTAVYVVYITFTLRLGFAEEQRDDQDEDDDQPGAGAGLLGLKWLLDFNARLFGGQAFSSGRAWVVLLCAVIVIGVACSGIAWSVEASARFFDVEPYFTAVILAAAATSVPDTILSVKDALRGKYDDAVANAIGSNIFDITVCLGVPLLAYGLIEGDVVLAHTGAAADVQVLQWVLLGMSLVVIAMFVLGRGLGRGAAITLVGLYAAWSVFVVGRGADAAWTHPIVELLPGHSLPVVPGSVAE